MIYYINFENGAYTTINQLHAAIESIVNEKEDGSLEVTIATELFELSAWHVARMVEDGYYLKLDNSISSIRKYAADKLPDPIVPTSDSGAPRIEAMDLSKINITPVRLVDQHWDPILFETIKSGTIVDKFWSEDEGLYRGTITMISGDPGAGKTSVLVSNLLKFAENGAKIGIVSAEMKELDLERSIAKYYPEIRNVDVLYPGRYLAGKELDSNGNPIQFNIALAAFLDRGYDVILLDSMKEIQEIFRYELGLSKDAAEFVILDILERNCEGNNREERYTSFLMIQQVGKNGEFTGSQRLVHMINARVELRNCKEIKGGKYMVFKKNRNGLTNVKLYYKMNPAEGIVYDEDRLNAELELAGILNGDHESADVELTNLLSGFAQAELDAQMQASSAGGLL